jgi:N6-adenosine-specific RNA methylase IME4
MQFHPLAEIFPLIEGDAFAELAADIKAHGLREPIVVFENKILDGRNRYRACEAAGVEPTFTVYQGEDPISYVISLNLRRRHLNESQTGNRRREAGHAGARCPTSTARVPSIEEASRLLNVGHASVERAKTVQRDGAAELIQAVERGGVSVSAAADVAALPKNEQREIVARGEKEILEAAKAIRAEKATQRCAARVARITEISVGNNVLPSERRYPIIYADPPWHYSLYNETTGSARAAAEHYPTMKLSEICALPVADLATDDAILFMWTTAPHLQEAFEVLAAWGFEYKTNAVWVKHAQGLGFFVRGQHELLLIATCGDMPCPLPANRPPSIIQAPRREHSQKPDEAYELIEAMYPDLPRIELFARNIRPGWMQWGNQIAEAAE